MNESHFAAKISQLADQDRKVGEFRIGAGEDTTIAFGQIIVERQEGLHRSPGGKITIGRETSKQEVVLGLKFEIWHDAR